jgi:hypothetical protein
VGRTLNEVEKARLIVELKKVTYPDGSRSTRPLVPFDIDGLAYNPNSDIINEVVPKIDQQYQQLVERSLKDEVTSALDKFLQDVSNYAIVSDGLLRVLAEDIGKSDDFIEKALMSTNWYGITLKFVRDEFRKGKKNDPIKYAEAVWQIIGLFGLSKALKILNRNDVKISDSTARALCKVASDTPKIKQLIREGKLKLTIAFELPSVEEKEREKIAEQVSSVNNYQGQKNFLKNIKEHK